MILHHQFVKIAKKYNKKIAIVDRTRNSRVDYSKALIASLILTKKIKKYEENHIGLMIPTSAGCMLATLGTLMAGKIPVMINYSTHRIKSDSRPFLHPKPFLRRSDAP